MRWVSGDYLLGFFDRRLKDKPSSLLGGPAFDHPEVVLGTPEVLFEDERSTIVG